MASEDIEVHRSPGAEVAIVTFGSFVNPNRDVPSYAFMRTCLKLQAKGRVPFDVWYFLANANDWYLGGIQNVAGAFEASAARVTEKVRSYRRSVFVGNSMGGFAAMGFGALAGASEVLAISPQTRFDPVFLETIRERRWSVEMREMAQKYDVTRYRLASLLEAAPHAPKVNLLVGADCPQDCAYAEEVAAFPNIAIERVPGGDHDLAHALRDSGRLGLLLRNAVESV